MRSSKSKVLFALTALATISALFNTLRLPLSYETTSRKLTSTSVDMSTKRILIAIPSYGRKQFLFLQDMLDSLHDICETGAQVTVFIYTTEPYTVEELNMFNSRTKCFNPTGTFDITVKIKAPSLKLHFVDAHRKDFYDRIDDYDLFIYTEDDHHVRPTHAIGYLHETEKLKQVVGEEAFPNYSIGFLRYERDHSTGKRSTFDQYEFKFSGLHSFSNPVLKDKYVGNRRMPHQGMFMATAEQLRLWKDRCKFDEIDPDNVEREDEKGTPTWHREFVSSLRLFANEGVKTNCEVTQLFPAETFEFFMLHHMPDKYFTNPKFKKDHLMSTEDLHKLVLRMVKDNKEIHKKVGTSGEYNGVRMEMAPEYSNVEEGNEKISDEVRHTMSQYYDFVKNGGDMMMS